MSDELRVKVDEAGHEIKIMFEPATGEIPVVMLAEQGPPGVDGDGEGFVSLVDDPDPTLGADLKLNGHGIDGQLETPSFVMDGGLLG